MLSESFQDFSDFSPPFSALKLWDDREQARSGAVNMAVDEALLAEVESVGEPVLRLYRWDRPTLTFGYFLAEQEARANCGRGESMVRRWTGGGMVHHEAAVTWSLAVPQGNVFCRIRPAVTYAQLHGALACCLSRAGFLDLALVPESQTALAGGGCAEVLVPGDLLWHGCKIAGAGQRRARQGLLHQGVIFLPETDLPSDLPWRLATVLTKNPSFFSAPANWVFPVARYQDPAWNARC